MIKKFAKCNIRVDQFFNVDDGSEDMDSVTVNGYYHISLPEGFRIMAEYMEKHPDGYTDDAQPTYYYYKENGHEFGISITTDQDYVEIEES